MTAMAKSRRSKKESCLSGVVESSKSERLRHFLTDCLNDGYRYIGVNRISSGLNIYPLIRYSTKVDICLSLSKGNVQDIINKLIY